MERLLASRLSQGPLVADETGKRPGASATVHVHTSLLPQPTPKRRGLHAGARAPLDDQSEPRPPPCQSRYRPGASPCRQRHDGASTLN